MPRKPKYRRHSTRDLGFAEHSGKRHYFPGSYGSKESLSGYQSLLASAGFFVVEEVCQLVGWQGENCKTFRNKQRKPTLKGNALEFSGWREWLRQHPRAFSQFPESYSECKRRLSIPAV